MSQAPSIGRIVLYALNAGDAYAINARRQDAEQPNQGNFVHAGDVFPMVITRVWTGTGVNGQLMLDGNDLHWACSKSEGEGDGTWAWPQRS